MNWLRLPTGFYEPPAAPDEPKHKRTHCKNCRGFLKHTGWERDEDGWFIQCRHCKEWNSDD